MIQFNIKPSMFSGRHAHIWQRISAFYLLLYTPFLAWTTLQLPSSASLKILAYQLDKLPFSLTFGLATLGAFSLIFVHAWVGVRDILIDYLPRQSLALWLTLYHSLLALILINCLLILMSLFAYA